MDNIEKALVKPLVIVVHGVGRQSELHTLKSFIEGLTATFDLPNTMTRAQLADQLRKGAEVSVDAIPFALQEFNYARTIRKYRRYAEDDPRAWIRSSRNRLREINRNRHGPPDVTFIELEQIIDDILVASQLARLIAVRFHLETDSLQYTAFSFMQQVQLYLDYPPYRDDIENGFQKLMNKVISPSKTGRRSITLVAHSLGTVVILRALLQAAAQDISWAKSIARIVTFGSPIDLFLLLYPDLFTQVPHYSGTPITWANYSLGNDPIATDLAFARHWIAEKCPNLFVESDPDEIDLGPGSITGAHTDYWHNDDMFQEICAPNISSRTATIAEHKTERHDSTTSANDLAQNPLELKSGNRSRSAGTMFRNCYLCTGAIAAWLVIVWWEENLKEIDSSRVVIGNAIEQVVLWVVACSMIIFHVKSLSATKVIYQCMFCFFCFLAAACLIVFLPALPLLIDAFPNQSLDFQNPFSNTGHLAAGNIILLVPPLSAFIVVLAAKRIGNGSARLSKKVIVILLAVTTVGLSLFVGRRSNASNISEEIGILSLALGIWWLTLLFARIDHAFKSFIGGRDHLQILGSLWGQHSKPRAFRRIK